MELWCCDCGGYIHARLTTGAEIYPHRPDLAAIPRWICDSCKNHVGTHHKTNNPTKPLGNIPNKELSNARRKIHELIDPYWKSGAISRRDMYKCISKKLGYDYHTASIKTIDEARRVYIIIRNIIAKTENA